MLRINLLPDSVRQRRNTRKVIFLFAGLLILCIALPLVYYATQKKDLADLTQQADTAEQSKTATDALTQQATSTLAKVGPIKAKLDFVEAVHAYDRQWVALYNTLAETSPKSSLIYTDASVNGATMTIKAYSPSLEEVGRYLQTMYQEPDFQTVAVDHVPGYPDNVRHLYYLNGVLVFADGASGSSSSGGMGGSSPMGGMSIPSPMGGMSPSPMGGMGMGGMSMGGMSMGGGQSSSGSSGGPSGWGPDNLGPNAPGNLPPGVTAPPAQLTGGKASSAGSGSPMGGMSPSPMGGGMNTGGGANSQSSGGYSPAFLAIAAKDISPFALPAVREQILQQALRRVVVKEVPKGFDLTVTATLKQQLTPPSLPGAAPANSPGMGRPGGLPGMGMPGGGPPGMGGRPAA